MGKKTILKSKAFKLRLQLEGKQVVSPPPKVNQSKTKEINGTFSLPIDKPYQSQISQVSSPQDTIYLKKDLTKIALLSAVALAAQLLLVLAQRNGLLFRGF